MPQNQTYLPMFNVSKIWRIQVLGGKMETIASQNDSQRINALIAKAMRITPKDFDAAWAAGRELSLAEAIALAMMQ